MSDYLPRELQIEILLRLPVKSLLRFMSVCKSWHSVIASSSFVEAHTIRAISSGEGNTQTFLIRYFDPIEKRERYRLVQDDERRVECSSEIRCPFKSSIGYLRIVGSCNGLICICDDLFDDLRSIILWNPSVRRSFTIGLPDQPQSPYMCVLGFGVSPVNLDPKVVRITYLKDILQDSQDIYRVPAAVDIYSCSSGVWRRASSGVLQCYMVEFTWSQAFFNGAVHWLAYKKCDEGGVRNMILSFDVVDEVFHEIAVPAEVAGELPTNLSVSVHKESLAATLKSGERMVIWVMKENGKFVSWTKLFDLNCTGVHVKTVGFRANGNVVLALQSSNALVSYEPEVGLQKFIDVLGNVRSIYFDVFMETLLLFNGDAAL